MRDFALVTLTRFPEIFNNLTTSVGKLETSEVYAKRKIVVTSGEDKGRRSVFGQADRLGWERIGGIEPFNFARNANLALSTCSGLDILLVNDDVSFTNALTPVMDIVEANPGIGIVSPQIDGGVGNILQSLKHTKISTEYAEEKQRLAFVCVYIRKEVLDVVKFDEHTFGSNKEITYGGEDSDFCCQAIVNGFKLVVTPNMVVRHGFEQYEYSSSFLQVMTPEERNSSMYLMRERLNEKWN